LVQAFLKCRLVTCFKTAVVVITGCEAFLKTEAVRLPNRAINAATQTVFRRGRRLLLLCIVMPFVEGTADVERIMYV